MKLTEGEGKLLFKEAGIEIADFLFLEEGEDLPKTLSYPVMIKAQTLSGGRGKAGLVKRAANEEEAKKALAAIWKSKYTKRPFEKILIEPRVFGTKEYYVSIAYDTETKGPVLVLSKFGGMDIETVAKRQPQAIVKTPVNILEGIESVNIPEALKVAGIKTELEPEFIELSKKLYACFLKNDAELVEINPLIESEEKKLVVSDAKVMLDDTALYRHDFSFPRRTGFRALTEMEQKARQIDARSHRGVVGRTLLELDGDIAVMSSGGGASVTCLDALISFGGRPACFAEYSGNPEREDVKDLAKLILAKEGLRALWIVGPTANFTDVFETLGGIMDAIKEVKPSFPILIRRAGPRDDEAREMVKKFSEEHKLDLEFYSEDISMTESAKLLIDKIGVSN